MFTGSPNVNLVNNGCTAATAICNQLAADLAVETANVCNEIKAATHYPVARITVGYKF